MFSSIININILVTFACISLFFKVNSVFQILRHISRLFFRSVYSFEIFLMISNRTVKCAVAESVYFWRESLECQCMLLFKVEDEVARSSRLFVHHAFICQQGVCVALIASFFPQDFLCMSDSFWAQVFAFLYLSLSWGWAGTFRPPGLTFLSPAIFTSLFKKHFSLPSSSPLFWPSPTWNLSTVFLL